jgi:hypothetical protein
MIKKGQWKLKNPLKNQHKILIIKELYQCPRKESQNRGLQYDVNNACQNGVTKF